MAAEKFENYAERQVREAIERGDFDNNPLAGKPVNLGRPGAEKPWIASRLEREDLSGVLPPPLQLRRAKADLQTTLASVQTEAEARQIIAALNQQIRESNISPLTRPRIVTSLVDTEAALVQWRAGRLAGGEPNVVC